MWIDYFRRILLFLLFVCSKTLSSQVALYGSFLGDDALVAINMDLRDRKDGLLHYSIRWGVGYWSDWGGGNTITIPHHITALFGNTHALEAGFAGAYRPQLAPRYRLHTVLGYRYQKRPSGLIIRAYIDPIRHKTFHYQFGLAIGHSF
jgi:hypothetical protein